MLTLSGPPFITLRDDSGSRANGVWVFVLTGADMAGKEKTLWVVEYSNLGNFAELAAEVGATAVAIRTDNNVMAALPVFHTRNIKVYGWRWPHSSDPEMSNEANRAANLFANGMDGYICDPEAAKKKDPKTGKQISLPWDWDKPHLETEAIEFCRTVANAANGKLFGITSHYLAAEVYPSLPYATFFEYANLFLPQSYWRTDDGKKIGTGTPVGNYRNGINAWKAAGAKPGLIAPMAGELGAVTDTEIQQYAAEAAAQGITSLHFYCYETRVKQAVWDAIKAA